MNTSGLRGFDSLRTRPITSTVESTIELSRCTECGAVLNRANITGVCCACSVGEVEIPEWMIAIVESDDRPMTVQNLARLLMGKPRASRYSPDRERNAHIRRLYATGDYSWVDLARLFGVTKPTIQYVLNGARGWS